MCGVGGLGAKVGGWSGCWAYTRYAINKKGIVWWNEWPVVVSCDI